ncbi:hypothetical protein [Actinophytocola xanthii]|uniref:Uncharacterized protein n=1 Tax=Actinophytocola xanthii TaxID=1912961 RepID=A0A1Q8CGK6_9PSEU|nr:hypothetical protein [Actinophytocola xanthii]OLF13486.1 hypothetical protein BU204_27205 [Actinophytocola xanthii]
MERQRKLNEERRRRDEAEVELAADFAVWNEECAAARDAVVTAEVAMGRVVDRLIGELRVRYPRAAQLLEMPEDELRRLRQLAAESASRAEPVRGNPGGETENSGESGEKNRSVNAGRPVKRGRTRSRRDTTSGVADAAPSVDMTADVASAAGATVEHERGADASETGTGNQDQVPYDNP